MKILFWFCIFELLKTVVIHPLASCNYRRVLELARITRAGLTDITPELMWYRIGSSHRIGKDSLC